MDAFRADTFLLEYPYENIDKIDRGFRKTIWSQYDTATTVLSNSGVVLNCHEILLLQSNLGFYNLMTILTPGDNPTFISIGPFRDEEINLTFLQRIIADNKLTESQLNTVRHFYQSLPLISPNDIAATLLHLLEHFIPEYKDAPIKNISFSSNDRHFEATDERLDAFSVDYAKTFSNYLNKTLEAVGEGNTSEALDNLTLYANYLGLERSAGVPILKKTCYALNTLLYQTAVSNNVQPIYALRQFTYFDSLIDNSASVRFFQHMPYDLVHKYTILIKNYSFKEYSYLVRSIRNYIDLHLDEELSLQLIADYFNKNASYVSNTFKNEMGTTLTEYIQNERVHLAIRYLNSSDMSISEIASLVGFTDFGYFTKVFKRHIGKSPSEYRKMMKK